MSDKIPERSADFYLGAKWMAEQLKEPLAASKMSMLAAALGKKGGQAKVPKGFSTMSPERRSEIAKAAAAKRWGTKTPKPPASPVPQT